MVFYCEQASSFASDVGYQDESYFDALVRMFEQAVVTANTVLPEEPNSRRHATYNLSFYDATISRGRGAADDRASR